MLAKICNDRKIRKTHTTLVIHKTVLLIDGNCSAVVVYHKIILNFQAFFFQDIFDTCPIDKTVVLTFVDLPYCMVERYEQPASLPQVFVNLFFFIRTVYILRIDNTQHIVAFQFMSVE